MLIFSRASVGRAAINLRPRRGSWGGANQWTAQLTRWLDFSGWKVTHDAPEHADVVVMTHTGLTAHTTFGADEVERAKKRNPRLRVIHRINDNDIRKETSEMDDLLARSNRVADHTVFVSAWLRDHHASKWFDRSRPHSVIHPGADARFFHPVGNLPPAAGKPFRLVTHHWSDNWNKGFDIYRDIDVLIDGPLRGEFELWVIGRWPAELRWKQATLHGPASGGDLAGLLRQCHGYVSASRHEPGAMHVAEGLQCGLPLLFHPDSGGTVERGERWGVATRADLAASLREFRSRAPELRSALLADPPSGAKMCAGYMDLIQKLAADV